MDRRTLLAAVGVAFTMPSSLMAEQRPLVFHPQYIQESRLGRKSPGGLWLYKPYYTLCLSVIGEGNYSIFVTLNQGTEIPSYAELQNKLNNIAEYDEKRRRFVLAPQDKWLSLVKPFKTEVVIDGEVIGRNLPYYSRFNPNLPYVVGIPTKYSRRNAPPGFFDE